MSGDLGDVLAAVAAGVRDSQLDLDRAGLVDVDAFAWSAVSVTAPVGLRFRRGAAAVGDGIGPARLTVRVAFHPVSP